MIPRLVRCLTLLGLVTLTACATNPVTGGKNFVMLTESQEIELGRQSDPQIRKQFGVYDDAKLQAYVQHVGASALPRVIGRN
ncbi:MAG: hypothetical protein HY308_07855 [Gammaproteobacteria bacterium]|nr:hypothetical protein [Gammaproteobacteria bacterium]